MGSKRAEYWDGVIAEYRASGLSQEAFCRRRDVSVHSLRAWLYQRPLQAARAVARKDPGARDGSAARSGSPARDRWAAESTAAANGVGFVPIHVVADAAESLAPRGSLAAPLEVLLGNGRRVAVRPGFDAATLVQLVAALEHPPC